MSKHASNILLVLVLAIGLLHASTVQRVRGQIEQDNQTSIAITQLSQAIDSQYSVDGVYRDSLDDIVLDEDLKQTVDEKDITYEKTDKGYTLCAEFNRESTGYTFSTRDFMSFEDFGDIYYPGNPVDTYTHDAGLECFDYEPNAAFQDDFFGESEDTEEFESFEDFDFEDPEFLEQLEQFDLQ